MTGVRTGAVVVMALAMHAIALGAEHPRPSLGPEMVLFEEPLVSAATKSALGASAAPAAVSVVSRDDIRRHGYRTLAEALRTVRGFYSSEDRNYTSIGVRGFLRPGDYNDRLLLLVNGHTYNNDVYQQALLGDEFGIDMEAIERIEVVRGPGSALYGGNALFAVINVVTVGAIDADGVHPLVETGSFGRKRAQVSAGRTLAGGTEIFASGSALDVDGPGTLFYPELASPETDGVARNADAERAYNGFVSLRHGDFFLQGGYNRRFKEIPTGAFGTLLDDDTETVDSRAFAELTFTRAVRPDLDLTARVYYDGFYYRGTYVYAAGDDARLRNLDHAWSYWGGGEVRARWEALAGNVLTAGAELAYHPYAYQDNYDARPRVTYFEDHHSFGEWGVYVQDEWMLRPDLQLVTGVRFDRYDDQLNEMSPRAAVIWTPRQHTTLKLLYGRAFRPPNLYEQFYRTPQADPMQLANSQLEAETIRTFEVVLEHRLASGARAIAAAYRYDLRRLIDNVAVDGGTATQYRNLDDGIVAWGTELEARIPLRDRVALHAAYAYADARTGGHLLTNSPHHTGHAALLFPLPYGAEGGLDLHVIGPRLTLRRRHVGIAPLLNLTVELPPVGGVRLSGSVYNLFDKRYADPGGPEHVQDRIPQDGLTFRVALHYAF